MEETAQYMVAPTTNGDKPLPRRIGTRSMLPTTWISRELEIQYTSADGRGTTTRGVLCDWCPVGPVLLVAGARTILGWERICVIKLLEDG